MKPDHRRLSALFSEIRQKSRELNTLLDENQLTPNSLAFKAAKYLLIELAEAITDAIQHILAKRAGVAVTGYVDAAIKAREHGLISPELFRKLKPFFDFRNSLIHAIG